MAEEDDSVSSGTKGDSAAIGLALNTGAAADEARTYLREQTELARLQKQNLVEQNAFELSHLRWRRFNDQMKGALQIMVVALGALIVIGISAAMWNASQADGLVVDSFSVPPALAASGTAGDIVADDMTNKIAAIRDFANDHSLARSKDVRQDRDQDVKVEIPETGISLAEAWRYLRQWLGNEQHLSGNIRSLPDGRIALSVSLGGASTFSFTGATTDLDALEQQAAERVFATVDPVNIVLYLNGKGRSAETLAAVQHLVSLGGDKTTLSGAYSLYANIVRYVLGDARRSVSLAEFAIALDPKPAPQHLELMNSSRMLGHDEVVLQEARIIATLRKEDSVGAWRTGDGVPYVLQAGAFNRAMETGDFADAATQPCIYLCNLEDTSLRRANAEARAHDTHGASVSIAEATAAGGGVSADLLLARYGVDAESGDWPAAVSDARQMAAAVMTEQGGGERYHLLVVHTRVQPLLAIAQARTGDFAGAWSAINATPTDCYDCVRVRGQIAAAQKNWSGAQDWFADAAKQAPSVPFAYSDWGAMLMAKGDLNGAIAKFETAHEKGPHFADPLEMWGEALIARNRSDLALTKFSEAAAYAPSWGRLHLKRGEALLWSGDKDGAEKQLVIARGLVLTAAEQSELERMTPARN